MSNSCSAIDRGVESQPNPTGVSPLTNSAPAPQCSLQVGLRSPSRPPVRRRRLQSPRDLIAPPATPHSAPSGRPQFSLSSQGFALGYFLWPRWGRCNPGQPHPRTPNPRTPNPRTPNPRLIHHPRPHCRGPNGAECNSPGQSPGYPPHHTVPALKGRNHPPLVGLRSPSRPPVRRRRLQFPHSPQIPLAGSAPTPHYQAKQSQTQQRHAAKPKARSVPKPLAKPPASAIRCGD